jgi:hypothetical protein
MQWPKDTKEVNRPLIEGQTMQWLKDTKEVNRNLKSKDRQYNGQNIPKR